MSDPSGWDEVWVLVQDQKAAPEGRQWFKQWTGIGPMGTWDEAEAASFPSEQAAMQSPAFTFPLTFYKPECIAAAGTAFAAAVSPRSMEPS